MSPQETQSCIELPFRRYVTTKGLFNISIKDGIIRQRYFATKAKGIPSISPITMLVIGSIRSQNVHIPISRKFMKRIEFQVNLIRFLSFRRSKGPSQPETEPANQAVFSIIMYFDTIG